MWRWFTLHKCDSSQLGPDWWWSVYQSGPRRFVNQCYNWVTGAIICGCRSNPNVSCAICPSGDMWPRWLWRHVFSIVWFHNVLRCILLHLFMFNPFLSLALVCLSYLTRPSVFSRSPLKDHAQRLCPPSVFIISDITALTFNRGAVKSRILLLYSLLSSLSFHYRGHPSLTDSWTERSITLTMTHTRTHTFTEIHWCKLRCKLKYLVTIWVFFFSPLLWNTKSPCPSHILLYWLYLSFISCRHSAEQTHCT